jgi:hypothetical protein
LDEPKDGAPETLPENPENKAPETAQGLPAAEQPQPEETNQGAGTSPDNAEREAALQARERAIEVKERHFKALEMLEKRNLPQNLIDYIDLETEQSMRKSIELAARARTAPNVPEAPEGAGRPPKSGTYEEYRRYYTQ